MRYFRMKPDMTFHEVDESIYNLEADGINWIDNKFTFYNNPEHGWMIGECKFVNVRLTHHDLLISIIKGTLNYLMMETGLMNNDQPPSE